MTHAVIGTPTTVKTTTLGIVSFLNARPLREYLAGRPEIALKPAVPSRLIDLLEADQCDAALLPVVDFARNRESLDLVSDACIAGDGETLTVRVYARRAPEDVRRLHVDGDSHTSVVLGQLIWLERYGTRLEILPWQPDSSDDVEALLLIGDKVVTDAPGGFEIDVDLGRLWKDLTALPFVFAAWYGRRGRVDAALCRTLESARDQGVAEARAIARRAAPLHGWPTAVAERYLAETMKYTITPQMQQGMERFFELSRKHGLLP